MGRRKKKACQQMTFMYFFSLNECYFVYIKTYKKNSMVLSYRCEIDISFVFIQNFF